MWVGLFGPIWDALVLLMRSLPQDYLTPELQETVHKNIVSTMVLLPCSPCVARATVYLLNNPLSNIKTGQDAFAWVVHFHNSVNRELGKPEYTVEQIDDELHRRASIKQALELPLSNTILEKPNSLIELEASMEKQYNNALRRQQGVFINCVTIFPIAIVDIILQYSTALQRE